MVASTANKDIKDYFTKCVKGRELERGIALKMKVKLAAKYLVVAWTLMKENKKFDISCFQ